MNGNYTTIYATAGNMLETSTAGGSGSIPVVPGTGNGDIYVVTEHTNGTGKNVMRIKGTPNCTREGANIYFRINSNMETVYVGNSGEVSVEWTRGSKFFTAKHFGHKNPVDEYSLSFEIGFKNPETGATCADLSIDPVVSVVGYQCF